MKHCKTLVALTILMWATTQRTHAASYSISMTAFGFVPDYLEVTVGDRVYWWNEDYDYYDDHSTRSYTYPWNSGPVPVGYAVYLDTAKVGTFDYVDDWGYSGFGTLVVKPLIQPPPPPPTMAGPMRLGDGSFQCTVSNLVAGKTFYVQASTNLVDWSTIYTGLAAGPTYVYADVDAKNLSRRFYRAMTVP